MGQTRIGGGEGDIATPLEIIRFLLKGRRAGRRGVLATITGLTGTGTRAVGTHMAILDDRSRAGSFSSGCVEAAIVAEALDAISADRPRTVRFGHGSTYLDIRLPCGGGLDVLFIPDPDLPVLRHVEELMLRRAPVTLLLGQDGTLLVDPESVPAGDSFVSIRHQPGLKLLLVGHGAEVIAAVRLALAYGAEVEVLSPDPDIVTAAKQKGLEAVRLLSPASPVALRADPWTAMLFLFHDHDWEPPLLRAALETPAFWVGAMGSRGTHAARLSALAAAGVPEDALSRLRGPVGVIPSTRDPATLALSALTEIVVAYQAAIR